MGKNKIKRTIKGDEGGGGGLIIAYIDECLKVEGASV